MAQNDINPSIGNDSALQAAVEYGRLKVVQFLLKDSRVDPCAKDNMAMQRAMNNERYEVIKLLLATKKYNTNYLSKEVLPWAIRMCKQDIFMDLLLNYNVDPTVATSIHEAIVNECPSALRVLLIDGRADPTVALYGSLPVERAARKDPEMLKMLLDDQRVDPTPVVKDCLSVSYKLGAFKVIYEHPRIHHLLNPDELFHKACCSSHLEAIELLIRAPGVKPVFQDLKGSCTYSLKVCEFLLKTTDLDPRSENNTILRNAAAFGNIDVVKALIADGRASVSEPENDPPISSASYNGYLEIVKLLIDHGADPAAGNNAALKKALEKNAYPNYGISDFGKKRKLMREYLLTFPTVVYEMALPYANYQLGVAEDRRKNRTMTTIPKSDYPETEKIVIEMHQIGDLKVPSATRRAVWNFLTTHVAIFQDLNTVQKEVFAGSKSVTEGELIFEAMASRLDQENLTHVASMVRKMASIFVLTDVIVASGHEPAPFVDIRDLIASIFNDAIYMP